MSTIDEKRVFSDETPTTTLFVASQAGIVGVECSGGLVGEFGLLDRRPADAIAGTTDTVIAGTQSAVVRFDGEGFESIGFGPATAVGLGERIVAARTDRIGHYQSGEWKTDVLETAPPWETVTAVDGSLVGTPAGVYRLEAGTPTHVGLEDVRALSVGDTVLCATGSGLYQLANGWSRRLEAPVVDIARGETVTAILTPERCYTTTTFDSWTAHELPVTDRLAAVAIGERCYVVTESGTICIEDDGDWRTRSIGVPAVAGLAVR